MDAIEHDTGTKVLRTFDEHEIVSLHQDVVNGQKDQFISRVMDHIGSVAMEKG